MTPILLARGDLSPRFLLAADAPRTRSAAAPRQIGQPLQRRARIAEMGDERVEGARADIVAADQPQPVDPVGLGDIRRELCPVVHAAAALPNLRL